MQLSDLSPWVVKAGVSLGGLQPDVRQWVLGLGAHSLALSHPVTEAELNQRLKQLLQGPLAFLATDHVELRRWMVDAAWLQRDSWCRQYARAERFAEGTLQREIAEALTGLDAAAWVADQRSAVAAQRAAKRAAWQSSTLAA